MTGWPTGAATPPSSTGGGAPQPSGSGMGPDSRYRVETPEQLGLEYDLAGLGTRGLAAIVDLFVLSMSAWVFFCIGLFALAGVVRAVPGLDDGFTGTIAIAILFLLLFTYIWGYYVFFETVWRGQTPGKQWLKLRVVREGGYQITFSQAAIRNVVRLVDFLPGFYVVGSLVMLFEPRSRRLGDMVAGTLVIREPQTLTLESLTTPGASVTPAGGVSGAPVVPTLLPGEQLLPNLNRISAAESSLLGSYLQRRARLRADAAEQLARTLAPGFAQRIGYVPSGDVPGEFLARLARQIAWYQAQPAGSVQFAAMTATATATATAGSAVGQSYTTPAPSAAGGGGYTYPYGSGTAAAPGAAPTPPQVSWTPPPLPTFSPTPPSATPFTPTPPSAGTPQPSAPSGEQDGGSGTGTGTGNSQDA